MDIITRQEAIEQGLVRYFTGKPCIHGHIDERLLSSGQCKECDRLKAVRYYSENAKKVLIRTRQHHSINRDEKNAKALQWAKENPNIRAHHRAARRAAMLQAIPKWADKDAILLKYKERNCMNKLTGLPHHVDHIVPLQGKNICGLHVAENLRVILARDNLSKNNNWETV
jgi:5-methylcytosine-specific restriction endonuclease McrA